MQVKQIILVKYDKLLDDIKKLGMNTADLLNCLEWKGCLRRKLVKLNQPTVLL